MGHRRCQQTEHFVGGGNFGKPVDLGDVAQCKYVALVVIEEKLLETALERFQA